jgi:hypothetical protein
MAPVKFTYMKKRQKDRHPRDARKVTTKGGKGGKRNADGTTKRAMGNSLNMDYDDAPFALDEGDPNYMDKYADDEIPEGRSVLVILKHTPPKGASPEASPKSVTSSLTTESDIAFPPLPRAKTYARSLAVPPFAIAETRFVLVEPETRFVLVEPS